MGSRGPKPGDAGYRPPASLLDRLRHRSITTANGCWEWQGTVNRKGYGTITTGSRLDGTYKTRTVHTVAYELLVGDRQGLTLDHTCENKRWWNPEHLELVSNAENTRRRAERMTTCKRGHPWVSENIYRNPRTGEGQCRVCLRELARERKRRVRT